MLAKIWELIDCPNPGSRGSGYYCKRTGEATQLCWTYTQPPSANDAIRTVDDLCKSVDRVAIAAMKMRELT